MVGERRKEDERFLDHEKRLHDLEPVVESLQWHHRNDRLLERMNSVETAIGHLEKAPKRDGNGNGVETRLRWVEKAIWMAIGGFAVFEFIVRFAK